MDDSYADDFDEDIEQVQEEEIVEVRTHTNGCEMHAASGRSAHRGLAL